MESKDLIREFIRHSVDHFDASTPRIEKCLNLLTEDQIWQRPNPNSNSIGNLILHLCGNIGQWILSGIGGQEDNRQRDSEFAAEGDLSKAELLDRLIGVTNGAKEVMVKTDAKDLLQERKVQCYQMSGIGIIIHVVEHYSYHTGQIAFWTKLLLDKDLGFYEGQDLG